MSTNLLLRGITIRQFISTLMLIGLMLILTNKISAQANESEPTLIVKGIETDKFALFHTIKAYVENLDKWASKQDRHPTKFILNIDGIPFNGLPAAYIINSDGRSMLQYDLRR